MPARAEATSTWARCKSKGSEATLNVWETTAGGAATFQTKAWGRRELKINLSSGVMPQQDGQRGSRVCGKGRCPAPNTWLPGPCQGEVRAG